MPHSSSEHYHPSWLNPIRHVVRPPGVIASGGTNPGTTTQPVSGRTSDKLVQTGTGARTTVTYSVPGVPYTLTIKTTQRCYVQVRSLPSGTFLLENTLGAGVTQQVTVAGGSSTVEAFAGGSTMSVSVGGKQVGNVGKLGFTVIYKFNPSST